MLNDLKVEILFFADDIVLIAPSEENLQLLINYVNTWCITNKMNVNIGKTKMVHFRKKSVLRTVFEFYLIFLKFVRIIST